MRFCSFQAIDHLEHLIIEAQDYVQEDDSDTALRIDPKTFCKLGHFHLLLENYSKGKSYTRFAP